MAHSTRTKLLRGLRVFDDRRTLDPSGMVREDTRLGEAVGSGDLPPTFRIWQNGQALVITAKDARLPAADAAVRASTAEGWPVVVRDSGGTAVPHTAGILEVSLVLPLDRFPRPALEPLYDALCAPVRSALAEMGVEALYGDVPGSFCDGRFNLVARGRKLAGTSQRWRGGLPPGARPDAFVVAHMVLFVEADMRSATEAVNRFYATAGSELRFDPGAVITVAEAVGHDGPRGQLTDELRGRIAAAASVRV